MSNVYPQSIVCLTEESVETLALLGKLDLVKGVSVFVKRPEAALKIPKISFFTTSNLDKINDLKPDLILGFSDIQKDIARDLIGLGHNVFIANHRSLQGILNYIQLLSQMVGEAEQGKRLVDQLQQKIGAIEALGKTLPRAPKIYFEEWDEPGISAIQWVSDLIQIAGGKDIFHKQAQGILAKDRFVNSEQVITANPDIIFGCWCGKKVNIESIKGRAGWDQIEAVRKNQVFELPPEIFLQPGPAPIIDGLDLLMNYYVKWSTCVL